VSRSLLQYVAVSCSMLQSVLQSVAVCIAVSCSVLQCVLQWLQCSVSLTVLCSVLQCVGVRVCVCVLR